MTKRLTEMLAEVLAKSQTDEGRQAAAQREQHPSRASGWKRTRRGEWRGPCQCGGERDRAWARRGRDPVARWRHPHGP